MEKLPAEKNWRSKDLRRDQGYYRVPMDNTAQREIENSLSTVVFGQDRAIESVAEALLRAKAGMSDPTRPEFCALFAGPPGTGKTEMGRAIARYHCPQDPDSRLLIVSCANYQQEHDALKLTGAPTSYVGYGDPPEITPAFLNRGKNVIVLDEIEKAHPAVFRVMLGILDKARLVVPIGTSTYTNVKQTELHFTDSTILFTSNLGSGEMQAIKAGRYIGFKKTEAKNDIQEVGLNAVQKFFTFMPEFLNRLDAVITFEDLTVPVLRRILDKFIVQYNGFQRLSTPFGMTQEAKEYVISQTQTRLGGRELRRNFDKLIVTHAAKAKLKLKEGQQLVADLDEKGDVAFYASHATKVPEVPPLDYNAQRAKERFDRKHAKKRHH